VSGDQGLYAARAALLAAAIMHAEGFFVHDALPRRHRNPGDLLDAEGVNRQFENPVAGVDALLDQIRIMLIGTSHVYTADMTWRKVAELWTGGDNAAAWCAAVCYVLDVAPDSTLGQFAYFDDAPRDDAAADQPA
jgi:hypothetical protein